MPICKRCQQDKPIEAFAIDGRQGSNNFKNPHKMINGIRYRNYCKECAAKKAKEYRDARPGLWKKYVKSNYNGRIKKVPLEDRLLMSAIRTKITESRTNNKARHSNRPFDIDEDYLYSLWKEQKGLCYLTGVPMILEKGQVNSLSLDKVIPELGYVKGNVKWCCWAANRAKGDMSIELLVRLCKRIVEKCRDYRTDTLIEKVEPSRVDSSESKCTAPIEIYSIG